MPHSTGYNEKRFTERERFAPACKREKCGRSVKVDKNGIQISEIGFLVGRGSQIRSETNS
jgi:hypothetical protein